ncbi:hypothetical protein CFter6_4124 [Collimonas fungivorans]|uniref:Uncharacterized protein n=1 Tax=Collimonas fungivorans TaxID=158899 RepID=A0A127PFZ6_9BURK|nr:hypothetical protein CFter6_4124 [Collimonas fungivorans]
MRFSYVLDLYAFFICAHCRASSAAEIAPDAAWLRQHRGAAKFHF